MVSFYFNSNFKGKIMTHQTTIKKFDNKNLRENNDSIGKLLKYYLSKDPIAFAKYLQNGNNFFNFITNAVQLLISGGKYTEVYNNIVSFAEDHHTKQTKFLNFDKEALKKILLLHYNITFLERTLFKTLLDEYLASVGKNPNEDDYQEMYLYPAGDELEYIDKHSEETRISKYINPILNHLFTGNEKIKLHSKELPKSVVRDFYQNISVNTFQNAIEKFNTKKDNFIESYLEENHCLNFKLEFIDSSVDIIEQINTWNIVLLQGNSIFDAKRYTQGTEEKWVNLLNKSDITVTEKIYARSISDCIVQYMFLYCFKISFLTIKNRDIEKQLIKLEKFNLNLKIEYLYDVINLDSYKFNYIFFKLLEDNCNATDKEINFLINRLNGYKQSTYKKYKKSLP